MKQINLNVSGDPKGDTPIIRNDEPREVLGAFESPSRVVFHLPADFNGGANLSWTGHSERFLLPPDGWVGEGSWLGLPDVVYGSTSGMWTVHGSQFVDGTGKPVKWKGITHFRLLDRTLSGDNINDILTQVQEAGFNLVRVLGMKTNNTGWELSPNEPGYWDAVENLFITLKQRNLQVEFTAFADTKAVMSNPGAQRAYWDNLVAIAQSYDNVLIEFMNEYGHPTQAVNPLSFNKPGGITCSHGSGLTDSDGVKPYWDYMTYHARRDSPPDARGFTNYDHYNFQSDYPSLPRIPDEGIKPEGYGCDTGYARLLGAHANVGAGGTFHWSGGVNSDMMDSRVFDCAVAFTTAISEQ
jgi:hypothetical protein